MNARPLIGTKIMAHTKWESFKSKVISYHQCDEESVVVKKAHTNQEWVIDWRKAELLLNPKVPNYEI